MPLDNQDIGPRSRAAVLAAAQDAVADAIVEHIEREGLTLQEFMAQVRDRHGWGRRRTQELSAFVRRSPGCRWGANAAFEIAAIVGIPVAVDIGGRRIAA